MPSNESVKGYLFPIAIGLLAGSAVTAVMMLLAAVFAVKLDMALSSYPILVWIPVCCGGLAAGSFGSGFAVERKGLCGIIAAFLLWGLSLLLLRSPGVGELLRGGVLLLTGAALVLLLISARVFSAPLKIAVKVLFNTLLGLGALLLLNAAAPFTGISLGLNLFNAAVVGVLGVPGLGLLLLVQWIFT